MHKFILVTVAIMGVTWGLPVLSQESQDADDVDTDLVIEEIIVEATKRKESVQDIGISATVFSNDDLINIGAMDMQDIASRTPSLKFHNRSDLKLGGTSLRGIGRLSGASAASEEAVAYYVDEVYVGGGVGANLDLFDLERVEVLRGPQGTLFGRNSVGGAINITTRKPADEFEGYIDTTYGNYDTVRVQGAVSSPLISDRVYGKISGVYFNRDGYTKNLFRNERGDTGNNVGVRAQLRIVPTGDPSEMEFNINGEYRHVNQNTKFFDVLNFDPNSLLAIGLDVFGIPEDTDPYDRTVNVNETGKETLDAWSVDVHGFIRLRSDIDLNTITSYRTHDYYNLGDTDASPLDWGKDGDPEKVWRFSQEIRLTSNYDKPVNWIAGLYYLHQHATNLSTLGLGADEEAVVGIPVVDFGSTAETDLDSISGFLSLDYRVTDKLDLTVGGRYIHEEKSIDYAQADPFALVGGQFNLLGQDSWNAFTPSFTARYFVSDDVTAYASVSRGFKSGGFNDGLGSGANISFDPEYLWNYEGGLKTTWFNDRLLANISVFHMKWQDIQFSQDNPGTPTIYDPIVGNAARAHSTGFEGEFVALPTDFLKLGVNLSVVDAKFDEGVVPTGLGDGIPLGDLPSSPDYTLNLNAQYQLPISENIGDVMLEGEYLRQGAVEYSTTNDPIAHVDPVGVWNARLRYVAPGGKWTVTLWGKNLADEVVTERIYQLFTNVFIGRDFVVLAPPRTYGVTYRYNF